MSNRTNPQKSHRQEQELGAIWNATEWWVERGLQALGNLAGENLSRSVPEIVLGNAYMLHERLEFLSHHVRDIHQLACDLHKIRPTTNGDEETRMLVTSFMRDDIDESKVGYFLDGSALSGTSTRFSHHFASPSASMLAMDALVTCLRVEHNAVLSSVCPNGIDDDLEVLVFTHAQAFGRHITSVLYTRSQERCSYNVALAEDPHHDNYKYATILKYYLVRHRKTRGALGRFALISPYIVAPCTFPHVGVVQLRQPQPSLLPFISSSGNQEDGGPLVAIVPLTRIMEPCIIHSLADDSSYIAIGLWLKNLP